jgi:hypothetical protein
MILSVSSPNQDLNPTNRKILGTRVIGPFFEVFYEGDITLHPAGQTRILMLYNAEGRECFRVDTAPDPPIVTPYQRVWAWLVKINTRWRYFLRSF